MGKNSLFYSLFPANVFFLPGRIVTQQTKILKEI